METAVVSAATGALGPVLEKLTAVLGDERTLTGAWKSDIESIKSELELVHSVLPKIWGSESLDAPCKDWMTEVQELSYDMEDNIDDFVNQKTSQISLGELKARVKNASERSCEMQKAAETTSNCSKPVIVDPRSRFLHKDPSELVCMEALKDDLFNLVVRGVDTLDLGDARRRHSEATRSRLLDKVTFKIQMPNDKLRVIALTIAARMEGVRSIGITGTARDILEVVGCQMDPVKLVIALRKKQVDAHILMVIQGKKILPAVAARQGPHQIKTICIHGLPGIGKTALADLVYCTTEEQFDCRAFVSVSPSPDISEVVGAILTQVTNSPYAYTSGVLTEQSLIHELSEFLKDKRQYMIELTTIRRSRRMH